MWKYTPRDHKHVSILSGKGITCIGKGKSRRSPGIVKFDFNRNVMNVLVKKKLDNTVQEM